MSPREVYLRWEWPPSTSFTAYEHFPGQLTLQIEERDQLARVTINPVDARAMRAALDKFLEKWGYEPAEPRV